MAVARRLGNGRSPADALARPPCAPTALGRATLRPRPREQDRPAARAAAQTAGRWAPAPGVQRPRRPHAGQEPVRGAPSAGAAPPCALGLPRAAGSELRWRALGVAGRLSQNGVLAARPFLLLSSFLKIRCFGKTGKLCR